MEVGSISLRLDLRSVEELVEASKAYERMLDQTKGLAITKGLPINLDGEEFAISGWNSYDFHTASKFVNLSDLKMNGNTVPMEEEWMQVVIWDGGRGLTFRCGDLNENGFTLSCGTSRQALEDHLEAVKTLTPLR